jgi:ABC-type multidrug transport system fused ATPase/permease subunit
MPMTERVGLPPPAENVKPWFLVFALIFVGGSLSSLAYMIIGYYASLKASRKLFSSMLANLSRAPARFFDKVLVHLQQLPVNC